MPRFGVNLPPELQRAAGQQLMVVEFVHTFSAWLLLSPFSMEEHLRGSTARRPPAASPVEPPGLHRRGRRRTSSRRSPRAERPKHRPRAAQDAPLPSCTRRQELRGALLQRAPTLLLSELLLALLLPLLQEEAAPLLEGGAAARRAVGPARRDGPTRPPGGSSAPRRSCAPQSAA